MRKPTGTTNPNLANLLIQLRKHSNKHDAEIWKTITKFLKRSNRHRVATNLNNIDRYTKTDEIIVVPGKLLGNGTLSHPITISAWNFSEKARQKVTEVGGSCLSIEELMKKYPKGSNIRVMA